MTRFCRCCLALWLAFAGAGCSREENPDFFRPRHLAAASLLFDVGVTDIDGDSRLDIYTVNHSAREKLLINQGGLEFKDQLLELGLAQNLEVPTLNLSAETPDPVAPGLYIYRELDKVVFLGHRLAEPVEGRFEANKAVRLDRQGEVAAEIQEKSRGGSSVAFTMQGDARLTVRPGAGTDMNYLGNVNLGRGTHLDEVFLGPEKAHPPWPRFSFRGRDRHAMAWADYTGDGRNDLVIMSGGASGRLQPTPGYQASQLLARSGQGWEDRALQAGVVQGTCPTRQAAWTDFDEDRLLDLFVVCGRERPPRADHPDLLFRQETPGHFVEEAAERGLDIGELGLTRWLDADLDLDQDLLWLSKGEVRLYRNQGGRFEGERVESRGSPSGPTVGDFDQDGDPDVFLVGPNRLLRNDGGRFQVVPAVSLGLPASSRTAQFVDVDNDGRLDLYLFPQGVYSHMTPGRFRASQQLDFKAEARQPPPFVIWFDADDDGDRDLLMASRREGDGDGDDTTTEERAATWDLVIFENQLRARHWLEVDLIGSAGNRPALGARVELRAPGQRQVQQVGESDGSTRSQGHYRLYFGLGDLVNVDSLEVLWPLGGISVMRNLPADRRVEVREPG